MLKIRLQRVGRKHEPTFRLVLTDSKNSTKSGKYLENLGNYDSRQGEISVFKTDRITYWMSKGAQVSHTVHNMLISKKIVTGKKINVLPLKKPIAKTQNDAEQTQISAEGKKEEVVSQDIKEEVVETPVEAEVVAETSAEVPASTEEKPAE